MGGETNNIENQRRAHSYSRHHQTAAVQYTSANNFNLFTNTSGFQRVGREVSSVYDVENSNRTVGENVDSVTTKAVNLPEKSYRKVVEKFQKAGLSLSKAQVISLVLAMSNSQDIKLLNDKKLNFYFEQLTDLLDVMKKRGLQLNYDTVLREVTKYGALIDSGYDDVKEAESYLKGTNNPWYERYGRKVFAKLGFCDNIKPNETISDRLNRYYNINFSSLSPEEAKDYVVRYFNSICDGLNEANVSESEIQKLWRTDFAKLVANSTKEEQILLYNAFKSSFADLNINQGIYERIVGPDVFSQAANNTTLQDDSELLAAHKNDPVGVLNFMEKTHEARTEEKKEEYQKVYIEFAKKFFEQNGPDALSEIEELVKAGAELTSDQKKIWQHRELLKIAGVAQYVGLARSTNVSEEFKTRQLMSLDAGIQQYAAPIHRETLEGVNELLNIQAENMTAEELEHVNNIINEATNGNYSIVRNDIENGTHTELNPPRVLAESNSNTYSSSNNTNTDSTHTQYTQTNTQTQEQQTASQEPVTGGLGFQQTSAEKPAEVNTRSLLAAESETKGETSAANNERRSGTASSAAVYQNREEYREQKTADNVGKIAVDVFNDMVNACRLAVIDSVKFFKSLRTGLQVMFYENCNFQGRRECLALAKDSTIVRIGEDGNYQTHSEKVQVENAQERVRKQDKLA